MRIRFLHRHGCFAKRTKKTSRYAFRQKCKITKNAPEKYVYSDFQNLQNCTRMGEIQTGHSLHWPSCQPLSGEECSPPLSAGGLAPCRHREYRSSQDTHTHTHIDKHRATGHVVNPLESVLSLIHSTYQHGTIIRFLWVVSVNETLSSGCVTFFSQ